MAVGVAFALFMGAVGGLFPAPYGREEGDPDRAAGDVIRMVKQVLQPELRKPAHRPRTARRSAATLEVGVAAGSSAAIVLFCCSAGPLSFIGKLNAAAEVETMRVRAQRRRGRCAGAVILNATGYIVAAHKIQLAVEGDGQGGLDRRGEGRPRSSRARNWCAWRMTNTARQVAQARAKLLEPGSKAGRS